MLLSVGLGILAALAGQPGRRRRPDLLVRLFRRNLGAGLFAGAGVAGGPGGGDISRIRRPCRAAGLVSFLRQLPLPGGLRRREEISRSSAITRLTDDRIEALRARVEHQPHVHRRGLRRTPSRTARADEGEAGSLPRRSGPDLQRLPGDRHNRFAAKYARAIAYYRETETKSALQAIDALIAERPDDPYLYELRGQVLVRDRSTERGGARSPQVGRAQARRPASADQPRPGADRGGRPEPSSTRPSPRSIRRCCKSRTIPSAGG